MHTARSPSSIPTGVSGDALDLSLSGSQLPISKRPSSASPGKHFSRSVSVSVASESRGKRNTLSDASFGGSRSIKNLRRSNSTTQVSQQTNTGLSEDQNEDYLSLYDASSDGNKKVSSLGKTSPDRTTWNILDDQPRAFSLHSSSHSSGSVDSSTSLSKRDPGIALAASFTANNRSNKGAVGNSVTTILHNNYSEKPLTPKSSNQRPSFNNILKATVNDEASLESGSLTKSQKNFSSVSSPSNNRSPLTTQRGSPVAARRREATEEEAERFIQQVNQAAITIQRWYRRHSKRQHVNQAVLKRILASKKKEWEEKSEQENHTEQPKKKAENRKRVHEGKARLAHLSAFQELQQRRGQPVGQAGQKSAVGHRKPLRTSSTSPASLSNNGPMSPTDSKAKNTDSNLNIAADFGELSFRAVSPASPNNRGPQCSQLQEILQRSVSVEDQRLGPSSSRAQSKTTLNELLDNLKLLEEEPERLSATKCYHKEKYAWIDEDGDSNSLTPDNMEHLGHLGHHPALPDGGALLSEAKLQSIMSFLDEMEKSEQERPRSVTLGSNRALSEEELPCIEPLSATAAEVSSSMMRLKLELEDKKRTVGMLQTAVAQQRELTLRHEKEKEKELSRKFQLQKEQYESTIQRQLTFIDQLINDKKALSERCEGVVAELKQVDQKYTKKMSQMQEQHDMVWQILGPLCEEIKKLKDLMSATEKIRKEKWIDEKTKKIKEMTVKGLEPEIQKLISKHKQELKTLRTLHETELQRADERAAQRYAQQCEELREQLQKEKEEQWQREQELAKHRYEKQLQEEEVSLQHQRRRLYKELADEKEQLAQLASRQRLELEDLRRQLEDNSALAGRALREELDKAREEQERRHQQAELKALQERLDIDKQHWEENYKKKEEVWLLTRERELKEDLRRQRDKEIELAIFTLEEETSKDKVECERAADNRVKRVRDKYEAELRELEQSERAAVEKHQELRRRQIEMEAELIRLQALLRQREEENEEITQARDKLLEERRSLAEVIRQEFAERLVTTEEENRRMKVELSEVRVRLRLEVERITKEKELELAEVHQRLARVKVAILKKDEVVNNLRRQHEAALKRSQHLEALWEEQRKQLLQK
uniref:Centrosomal protein 131 n=1 Tax=Tetraodon nigroviridis TaxID=99883 RepID=H3D2U6_TETNG